MSSSMKAFVTFDESALVAGMHPLGPSADVLLGPPRRRGASQRSRRLLRASRYEAI